MDPSQSPQQSPVPGYGTVTATPPAAPKRGRTGLIIGIIVLVLLAGVGTAGYLHYNGPIDTVKGFFNDVYVNFNGTAAFNRICSDATDRPASAAEFQTSLDAIKGLGTFDISKATYSLASENIFSDATVNLGGTIKGTINLGGQTQSEDIPLSEKVTLKSTGFGWCISGGTDSIGPSN